MGGYDPDQSDRDVHYRIVRPPYLKQNGGSIVITSSINGSRKFSGFGMSAYSTSKAGQVAFAKMAALELARYRIRVNVICPGAIETISLRIRTADRP